MKKHNNLTVTPLFSSKMSSPLGELTLITDNHTLVGINFPGDRARQDFAARATPIKAHTHHTPPLLCQAKTQLDEYFQGKRKIFDLPLRPQGTSFQQAVWACMQEIPFAETRSYGEIATALGNPNKARAVGGAANKNLLPIVIPCHRVIGSTGSLTGFAGGLHMKQFLLDMEKKIPHCIG
ncbi:MAG: methylated-DNA--[protein]-cysteine S-methyltransferase [Candidatus Electrothrix aestuarii]|uniref:Methylated-DNA--protein-cysteine methyltransferase n=1 Tax=Candidatus Electrothrix aestuarii TaxID=3062594 RepID=A0AAU8LUC8_9BACT|nr:methylated-DNA--[protein]-cysteine S-methyltransferase [Candidatus Electrothrix aestuarii]